MNPLGIVPKIIGGGLLAVILALGLMLMIQKGETQHEHKLRVRAEQNLVQFTRDVDLKTAKAKADDLAHARTVEQRNETIRQENSNAIQRTLAAELAHARRVRPTPAADPGGRGIAGLPGPGNAAGHPDAADTAALVDAQDIDRCTEAVVKLEGWQTWHRDTLKEAKQ